MFAILLFLLCPPIAAQTRAPMKAVMEHSAEHEWLAKPVLDSRVLDDATLPGNWKLQGAGQMSFGADAARRKVRVEIALQGQKALPMAAAVRAVAGEDWRAYNRLSFWFRTELSGFPV